jgi:hypothetical protein
MSSTYSNSLRVELVGSGDKAGTWGTTTNNNFAYIFDTAIAGYLPVTISSSAQALTYVNGPTSTAALNQSVYAILKFNSAAAASAVYAPPASKQYIIWNNSSFTITIYNSTFIGNTTAAGAGIAIAAGDKIMVWSDGTNFYDLQAQNLTSTLAIAKGGTGQTTQQAAINALAGAQTNNRVLRSDGTNTTLSQVNVATDVTGTLAIANGGTGVTTLAALGNLFYPIGSIYSNASNATNPGTLLGFGTWAAFGAGRVMIGNGGGFSAGATGGSNDATLVSHSHTATSTVSDPGHFHSTVVTVVGGGGAFGGQQVGGASNSNNSDTKTTGITVGTSISTEGSSATNANLQPYIVVYMWQRTA